MKRWNLLKKATAIVLAINLAAGSSMTSLAESLIMDDPNETMTVSYDTQVDEEQVYEDGFDGEEPDVIFDENDVEELSDDADEDVADLVGDGWEVLDNGDHNDVDQEKEDEKGKEQEDLFESEAADKDNENAAVAVVRFITRSGNLIAEKKLYKELEDEIESYSFTLKDIEELLPENYTIVDDRAQLAVQISQTEILRGETVEFTVQVAALIGLPTLPLFAAPLSNEMRMVTMRQAAASAGSSIPSTADIFFNAADEKASFNTQNWWDSYAETLVGSDNSKNNLKLHSSTDGAIIKANLDNVNYGETGSNSKDGVLRIDYETGNMPGNYTQSFGSNATVSNYSDGSYTIVGWGGKFKPSTNKNKIQFWMKSGDNVSIDTILSYVTIRLYYEGQEIQNATLGNGTYDLKKVDGETENGYQKYELALKDSGDVEVVIDDYGNKAKNSKHWLQGIKFCFDRGNEPQRGVLLVEKLSVTTDNDTDTPRFSPFAYNWDKTHLMSVIGDAVTYDSLVDGAVLPFLRDEGTAIEENNTKSGRNRSNYDNYWHMWTMSTSDGNIVTSANNGTDRTALQIKYNNQNGHETYTNLVGTAGKTGEWLVVTLKGDDSYFNNNIAIDLYNGGNFQKSVKISEFQTSMTDETHETEDQIKKEYRTLYYKLNNNYTFNTVKFNFDGVSGDTSTAVRRMYVTEIYLLNPVAELEKEVKVANGDFTKSATTAHKEDILTYKLTVKNTGDTPITDATVTDAIPAGLSNAMVESANKGTATIADGAVRWTGITLTNKGDIATVTFTANVTATGVYTNQGVITKLNRELESGDYIYSNTVVTTVQDTTPDEYVFYAEVGQQTDLAIALGQTTSTTSKEITTYTIGMTKGDDGKAVTATLPNVTIPEGATVTLTSADDGGFVIEYIKIGDQTFSLKRDDSSFTPSGTLGYHVDGNSALDGAWDGTDAKFKGYISKFYNGAYITLNNVNAVTNATVTVYSNQVWNSNKTFMLKVTSGEDSTTIANDTVKTVPATGTSAIGASISENGIVGQNSGSIKYTSINTGKDEFNIIVNQNGTEKTVKVTVYNYQVKNHVYVLDYGLSVNLTKEDASNTNGLLADATLKIDGDSTGYALSGLSASKRNTNNVADASDYTTPYGAKTLTGLANGTVSVDSSNNIIFTPTKFMSAVDTFYYGVQVTKENEADWSTSKTATPVMEGEIKVMPASIVYYEDNFASSGTGADGSNGIKYIAKNGTITVVDKNTRTQSNSRTEQYGYDESYNGDLQDSNNTVVTLATTGDKAVFQFKGTGFEILSRTSTSTGSIVVNVYDAEDGNASIEEDGSIKLKDGKKALRSIILDTYYENADLYQVPVISVTDLSDTPRTYIVSITAITTESKVIYLDGIRIYNPLDKNEDAVKTGYITSEQSAEIKEIKNLVLGDGYEYYPNNPDTWFKAGKDPADISLVKYDKDKTYFLSGMTVTENFTGAYYNGSVSTDKNLTAQMITYAIQGPNNELYVNDGYGIGFYAEITDPDDFILQIGMKAVLGSPKVEYLNKSGEWQSVELLAGEKLSTDTEMYYPVKLQNCMVNVFGEYLVLLRAIDGTASFTHLKIKNCELTGKSTGVSGATRDDSLLLGDQDIDYQTGWNKDKSVGGLKGKITIKLTLKPEIVSIDIYDVDPSANSNAKPLEKVITAKNSSGWLVRFMGTSNEYKKYYLRCHSENGNYSPIKELG